MEDDESLHLFGNALKELTDDNVAVKKPIHAEDQIVTDENGKRRFHGAFTGGFSAGYWNTVGSLHGWVPQTFVSSRSEKAEKKEQKPEDFMDDEDLGQFGIAPKVIQASDDFAKGNRSLKRKLARPDMGPIPGEPVLAQLLRPIRDKAAVRILKAMGWKEGQGIGPRQTKKQKKVSKTRNQRELYIWQKYCDDDESIINKNRKLQNLENSKAGSEDDDEEEIEEEDEDEDYDSITFAPDDIEPLYLLSKDDTFGFGYTGLLGQSSSQVAAGKKPQRFNLFEGFEFVDKNNKKVAITGQAFGVGAMEEEDEDIYAKDDMTKYDFTLENKKTKKKETKVVRDKNVIAGFIEDTRPIYANKIFYIQMPKNFRPRNWAKRKSRFDPLPIERKREIEQSFKEMEMNRSNLDADKRGVILGEEPVAKKAYVNPFKSPPRASNSRSDDLLAKIAAKGNNFTSGGVITESGEEQQVKKVEKETKDLLDKAAKITKNLVAPSQTKGFKPFLGNEEKQERYDKFIASELTNENEIKDFLYKIQPSMMSDWDREMETREFIQARKIYKPLGGIMSERFVTESLLSTDDKQRVESVLADNSQPVAKKIEMQRTKTSWKPASLLCKRYNIAETLANLFDSTNEDDQLKSKAKKSKVSVFDYLEFSVNKKEDFVAPVIIPKHVEKTIPLPSSTEPPIPSTQIQTKAQPDQETSTKLSSPEATTSTRKPLLKHLKYTPKTQLEKDLQASQDKPLTEKTELFKAIFADSDSEEDEENETDQAAELAKAKENAKNDLIKDLNLQKSAATANVLRNTSPPRGIFKALLDPTSNDEAAKATLTNSTALAPTKAEPEALALEAHSTEKPKIVFQPRQKRNLNAATTTTTTEREAEALLSNNLYGPALPAHLKNKLPCSEKPAAESLAFAPAASLVLPTPPDSTSSKFKWIEKTADALTLPPSSDSSSSSSSSGAETSDGEDSSSSSDERSKKKAKSKAKHKSNKKKKKSEKKKSKKKEKEKSKSKKKEKSKKHEKKHSSKHEKKSKKHKKKSK